MLLFLDRVIFWNFSKIAIFTIPSSEFRIWFSEFEKSQKIYIVENSEWSGPINFDHDTFEFLKLPKSDFT